jgi:hypothetical protein
VGVTGLLGLWPEVALPKASFRKVRCSDSKSTSPVKHSVFFDEFPAAVVPKLEDGMLG